MILSAILSVQCGFPEEPVFYLPIFEEISLFLLLLLNSIFYNASYKFFGNKIVEEGELSIASEK